MIVLASFFVVCAAHAENWPSRLIKATIPFGAGSATDVVPRLVFDRLAPELGQPIVVENRAGAGGTLGTALVAKADPDGYSVLAHSFALTIALGLRYLGVLLMGALIIVPAAAAKGLARNLTGMLYMAAGIAATRDKLHKLIRVWTLGNGVGFGRYPWSEGVWEGGHSVVTLDDKERFCGCGGRGHMEGIMGHRAMRLRFLDMEPEEVFEAAKTGDQRCLDFKRLWHKALAAASATTIHMAGPGKIFLSGFNVRFLDMPMLKDYLQQMVKMSPLQSYSLEIVEDTPEVRVIGAAVSAEQAAGR